MIKKIRDIYMIYTNKDKRVYIGSSVNVRNRMYKHRNEWKHNKPGSCTSKYIFEIDDECDVRIIDTLYGTKEDATKIEGIYQMEFGELCVNIQVAGRSIAESRAAWSKSHQVEIIANQKRYREQNREKVLASQKKYINNNKHKIKAYYQANKERVKARQLLNKEQTRINRSERVNCSVCAKQMTKGSLRTHVKNIH